MNAQDLKKKWTTSSVLHEVLDERQCQDEKWGEQNHPDGTSVEWARLADCARKDCDTYHKAGQGTWLHILHKEVLEALSEPDPSKLRAELIQVAAVAVAWAEAIDRRTK